MATIRTRIQFRRDTAANWLLYKDVIPAAGEPCFEIDTGVFKIGDGITTYEKLKDIGGACLSADGKSIVIEDGVLKLAGFDLADVGAQPRKNAAGNIEWVVPSTDTVDGLQTTVAGLQSNVTKLQSNVAEVRGLISDNADAIGALETLVGGTAVSTQISTAVSTAKTELKGGDTDTDASATIAGAKKYADKLDAAMDVRVDALEAAVGEGGSVATQITTEIQKLDATVETAAIAEGQDGIYVKVTEVDGKLTAVEATIEVSNEINAAKSELEGKIGTVAEGKTLAGLIADNAAAIEAHKTAVDAKVTTLIGADADKSVRTIANEELAAQLIPETAAESLNTLQEIAQWIQDHPGDASAMNAAIEALQTKVGDTSVSDQIATGLANKVDKVDGKGLSTHDYTTDDKDKLSGIAMGAEVNQNTFSNITIGNTTIFADTKTDTLTFEAGSNVVLTPDVDNDKITIDVNAMTTDAIDIICGTVPGETEQLPDAEGGAF